MMSMEETKKPLSNVTHVDFVAIANFKQGLNAFEAKDYDAALDKIAPLAQAGDSGAQYYLGRMYHDGNGIEQSFEEAAKWYCLAAEAGNAEAQFHLGLMHYGGRGVAQSFKDAAEWFRRAGEVGHVVSLLTLGFMYESGTGMRENKCRAYLCYDLVDVIWDECAKDSRDKIARDMTPEQISIAKRMAKKCRRQNY